MNGYLGRAIKRLMPCLEELIGIILELEILGSYMVETMSEGFVSPLMEAKDAEFCRQKFPLSSLLD